MIPSKIYFSQGYFLSIIISHLPITCNNFLQQCSIFLANVFVLPENIYLPWIVLFKLFLYPIIFTPSTSFLFSSSFSYRTIPPSIIPSFLIVFSRSDHFLIPIILPSKNCGINFCCCCCCEEIMFLLYMLR